jgi:hypothetical protein
MKRFAALMLIPLVLSCVGEKKEISLPDVSVDTIANKTSSPAVKKTDVFEETVYKVIEAFENKDQKAIDQLTSSRYGTTLIYRIGAFNEYKITDRIYLDKPVPEVYAYPSFSSNLKLQYEELPKFSCEVNEWNKYGLYCDTIAKNTLLSDTPMYLNKYRGDTIPEGDIKFFKDIESNSRRVVLSGKDHRNLIFHLTLIGDKWYLTAVDRVTGDCSA